MKAKLKRTLTSVLPVSKNRVGGCIGCGACCKLPNPCRFLRYRENGRSYCAIYRFRPLNCRKYPRTASECLTTATCGFRFETLPEESRLPAVNRRPLFGIDALVQLATLVSWLQASMVFKQLKKLL